MRDYGKVYTRFWLKQSVLSWSDSAKLLGLYLLTCPHCNLLGCFRLPIGYVASDLNWDEQHLSELEQDQLLIRCEGSGWTLIRSFLKHNPIESSNQGKAAFRLLKDVPADFVAMALQTIRTSKKDLICKRLLPRATGQKQHKFTR